MSPECVDAIVADIEKTLGRALSEEGLLIAITIIEALEPSAAPTLYDFTPDRMLRFSEIDPEGYARQQAQVRENTARSHAELRGDAILGEPTTKEVK